MSVIINGHEIDIGTNIKFSTINTYDNVVWIGVVTGIVDYGIAKMITDIDKYHAEVLKDTPGLDPADTLQYIVIETVDDGSPSRKVAFAVDWIEETSLEVITVTDSADFRVFNIPETEIQNVLNTLLEAGYKASFIG